MKHYDNAFLSVPFIHPKHHSQIIMRDIFVALIVLFLGSIFLFGYTSLIIVGIAYFTGIVFVSIFKFFDKSFFFNSAMWKNTVLIYALSLPPATPWFIVVIGVVVMFIFGQVIFSVNKRNIFHPALLGRVAVMTLFPNYLFNQWPLPLPKLFPIILQQNSLNGNSSIISAFIDSSNIIAGFSKNPLNNFDVISTASPLNNFMSFANQFSSNRIPQTIFALDWMDILLGFHQGALGETSLILLAIVFVWLVFRKAIDPFLPLIYIVVFCLWTYFFGGSVLGQKMFYSPVLSYSFQGSMVFSAIFLITDFSTIPVNIKARYVYTILTAIVASSLRLWSYYPDAHTIAILGMNSLSAFFEIVLRQNVFAKKRQIPKPSLSVGVFRNFWSKYFLRIILSIVMMLISYVSIQFLVDSMFQDYAGTRYKTYIKEVFPEYTIKKKYNDFVYSVFSSERKNAYIIFGSGQGFKSILTVAAVIDTNQIIDLELLDIGNETPEMGDQIFYNDWEKVFVGVPLNNLYYSFQNLRYCRKFDVISGATLTSIGVFNALKDIQSKFNALPMQSQISTNQFNDSDMEKI